MRNGKDNPLWCRNPQYFLNVSSVTLLKIILRKTARFRQSKGHTVGIVVCQAPIRHSNKKNPASTTKKIKTLTQPIEKEAEKQFNILFIFLL